MVFFKKIHLHGFDKLPKGKPILFASNHSNSFLDGIILEIYLKRRLYVLVRGDVFESKFGNWFYRTLRLLPIYRKTDGDPRETIGKNNASFDECYEYFQKGRNILIFSEAVSATEKTVRPIRKGTARMAFDMESRCDFGLGLHVVPMGINYTNFKGWGKELMVSIGDPIPVAKYKELYGTARAKATNLLTKEVEQSIKNEVVAISNPDLYQVADLYLDIRRSKQKSMLGKFHGSRERLATEMSAAQDFNRITEAQPQFANKLANLGQALQSNGIQVGALNNRKLPLWSLIQNILFLPFAILGAILYQFIPVYSKRFADKMAKQEQLKDSLIYGFSMFSFVLVTTVVAVVAMIFFGWMGLLVLPLLYFIKHSFFAWKSNNSKLRAWFKVGKAERRSAEEFAKIVALNQEILSAT
jgi:1-acyl-sn-glycerol-3-phosphate acyltransferase